jgi:hypothetical protein
MSEIKFTKVRDIFNCELVLENGEKFVIPIREDGYIYATGLCKASKKQLTKWKNSKETQILINKLSEEVQICTSSLIMIYKGQTSKYSQGTWVHPDLGIHLAQWCNPSFALQVSRWIKELIITQKVEMCNEKSDLEIQQKFLEIQAQLDEEKKKSECQQKQLIEKSEEVEKLKKRIRKNKPSECPDRYIVYIFASDTVEQDRLYVVGKTADRNKRLQRYNDNKIHEYHCVYYKDCRSKQLMSIIELNVLLKLDRYRSKETRDVFELPKDKDISLFTQVIDDVVGWFDDVDSDAIVMDKTEEMYLDDRKDNYDANREKILEYQDQYRENNKEMISEKKKEYHEENFDEISKKHKQWREDNREDYNKTLREYYKDNREELLEKKREYYKENKEEIVVKKKKYREEHKEETAERNRKWREKNPEKCEKNYSKRKEKVECECGLKIAKYCLSRHRKSEIHQSFLRTTVQV